MAKFERGKSGNPSGRPRGAKDKRTALRALLEPHREELVRVVVDKALGGDGAALRVCLDRLIAPVRSNPVKIEGFTGTLAERGEAVLTAIGAESISADEGAALLSMLQAQARIVEATDLIDRIAALEKRLTEGR